MPRLTRAVADVSRAMPLVITWVLVAAGFPAAAATAQDLVEPAMKLLRSGVPDDVARRRAAEIVAADPDRARRLAVRLGRSASAAARRAAVALLAAVGPEAMLASGVEDLGLDRDSQWVVRRDAVDALCGLPAARVEPTLRRASTDPVWSVRMAALRVASVAPEPAHALIEARLADPDPAVSAAAFSALVRRPPLSRSAVAALRPRLDDPATGRRDAAALWWALWITSRERPLGSAAASASPSPWSSSLSLALAPPSASRRRAVFRLLRGSALSLLGRDVAAVLLDVVVRDPELAEDVLSAAPTAAERAVCRAALAAPLEDWGTPSRHSAFIGALLAGRNPTEVALDELARISPPGTAALVEALVDPAAGVDEATQRRAFRMRTALDEPMSDAFLAAAREHPAPAVARAAVLASWARGGDDARAAVDAVASWRGGPPRRRNAATATLVEMARTPRPEAAALFRELLAGRSPRRLRLAALGALVQLGGESLTGLLARVRAVEEDEEVAGELDRHLVRLGHRPTIDEAVAAVADDPRPSLAALVLLDPVRHDDLVPVLERRLEQGRFDDKSLPVMIDLLAARVPRKKLVAILRGLLSGSERLSGNVLEHVLTRHDTIELVPDVLEALRSPERLRLLESVVDGLVTLAQRHDRQPQLAPALLRLWREIPAGTAGWESRHALIGPLLRCGGQAGHAVVVGLVRELLDQGLDDPAENVAALVSESVASAAGALMHWGGEAGAEAAFDLLLCVERRRALLVMRAAAQRREAHLAFSDELRAALLAAFEEAPDVEIVQATLERRHRAVVEAGEGGLLSSDLIRQWSDAAANSRFGRQPEAFVGRRLLEHPDAGMRPRTRTLLLLARALLRRGGRAPALLARALLARARRADGAPDPRPDRRARRLPTPSFLTGARGIALPRHERPWLDRIASWRSAGEDHAAAPPPHGLSAAGLLRGARALHGRGRRGRAWALMDEASARWGREPLVLEMRCRLLLDEERFEETLALAGRVVAGFARTGHSAYADAADAMRVLEAAALWGLGRRDQARRRLDELRARFRSRPLPGFRAADFPGLQPPDGGAGR